VDLLRDRTEWGNVAPTRHLRVLVVSDDSDRASRMALAIRLSRHYVQIVDVNALDLSNVLDYRPDVVVLHIRAFRTQGIELARLFRDCSTLRPLRKVALVAMSDFERDELPRNPRIDHFIKPDDIAGLQEVLEEVTLTLSGLI
jgi:response regulator RpfG family c-di-GMP phosphodiesterase